MKDRYFLILASVSLVLSILIGLLVFEKRKEVIIEETDSSLLLGASSLKLLLPEKYADRIKDKKSVTEKEFKTINRTISVFLNRTDLAYLYAMIYSGGKFHFISDSNAPTLLNTEFYSEYTEASDSFHRAVKEMQVHTDQIKDRWGDFRTLILPETAENGNRIVYSADIRLDSVKNRIQQSETEGIHTAVLLFFALTFFFIFLKIRARKNFLAKDYFTLKYIIIFIIISLSILYSGFISVESLSRSSSNELNRRIQNIAYAVHRSMPSDYAKTVQLNLADELKKFQKKLEDYSKKNHLKRVFFIIPERGRLLLANDTSGGFSPVSEFRDAEMSRIIKSSIKYEKIIYNDNESSYSVFYPLGSTEKNVLIGVELDNMKRKQDLAIEYSLIIARKVLLFLCLLFLILIYIKGNVFSSNAVLKYLMHSSLSERQKFFLMEEENRKIALRIGIVLIISFAYFYAEFNSEKRKFLEETDKTLLNSVKGFRHLVPGDFYDRLIEGRRPERDEFRNLSSKINLFARDSGVLRISSLVLSGDRIYSALESDSESDGNMPYLKEYKESRILQNAFEKKQILFEEYIDQWGSYRSVFFPSYSPDGNMYILKADFPKKLIDSETERKGKETAFKALTFLIAALFLVLFIFRRGSLGFSFKKEFKARFFRSEAQPGRVNRLFLFLIIILSLFIGMQYFLKTRLSLYETVDRKLLSTAKQVNQLLPPEHFKALKDRESLGVKEFMNIVGILNDFAGANELEYVYTMVLKEERVHYAFSSFTNDDIKRNSITQYFEEFTRADSELKQKFREGKVYYYNQYETKWGDLRSVILSFVTEEGEKYAVGTDVKLIEIRRKELFAFFSAAILSFSSFFILTLSFLLFLNSAPALKSFKARTADNLRAYPRLRAFSVILTIVFFLCSIFWGVLRYERLDRQIAEQEESDITKTARQMNYMFPKSYHRTVIQGGKKAFLAFESAGQSLKNYSEDTEAALVQVYAFFENDFYLTASAAGIHYNIEKINKINDDDSIKKILKEAVAQKGRLILNSSDRKSVFFPFLSNDGTASVLEIQMNRKAFLLRQRENFIFSILSGIGIFSSAFLILLLILHSFQKLELGLKTFRTEYLSFRNIRVIRKKIVSKVLLVMLVSLAVYAGAVYILILPVLKQNVLENEGGRTGELIKSVQILSEKFPGTNLSDLEMERFRDELNSYFSDSSGKLTIAVFSSEYKMIFHSDKRLENASALSVLNPKTGQSLYLETANSINSKNLYYIYDWNRPEDPENFSYRKIDRGIYDPKKQIYIIVSQYIDEIYKSTDYLESRILRISISIFLLSSLFGFFFIRRLLKPVESLSQAAGKIQRGDLSTRVKVVRKDEIGLLSQNFNQMAANLEKQTKNLEGIIEERTDELNKEKKKSEKLLFNILPVPIAKRLLNRETNIADEFSNVTVLFSDIVGFTKMSSEISAQEIVMMLDSVFTLFDMIMQKYSLEKIKTIGDAYMAAGGVFGNRDQSARDMIYAGLDMLEIIKNLDIAREKNLNLRIGIHSGPAVAGVIGSDKFAYDLWGDTVNTASRMESHGIPGRIQISEAVYRSVKDLFYFEQKREIEVKGKGIMTTYIIQGPKVFDL